ncbi:MAG: hypothetical protein IPF47_01595 [Gemmatimonadetes bacterium]|nr:hypothetical protein [Gemmatimonadota bacterium]
MIHAGTAGCCGLAKVYSASPCRPSLYNALSRYDAPGATSPVSIHCHEEFTGRVIGFGVRGVQGAFALGREKIR